VRLEGDPVLRAVTFDYWDTLVAVDRRTSMRELQVSEFGAALAAAGHEVDRPRIEELFEENWSRFEAAWLANEGQYTPKDTVDYLLDRLGLDRVSGLRDRLIDAFREAGEQAPLEIAPGAAECLAALRATPLRLGLVSDVGLTSSDTLRHRLDGFGLLAFFDAWAFSDETGWFKPAREAYRPILEILGVAPEEVVHVGDNPRTDVVGAKSLGMGAVRYAGFVDKADGPQADLVVHDLRSLPAALGL
jgi:putative hydrolase of the HAD superfamily